MHQQPCLPFHTLVRPPKNFFRRFEFARFQRWLSWAVCTLSANFASGAAESSPPSLVENQPVYLWDHCLRSLQHASLEVHGGGNSANLAMNCLHVMPNGSLWQLQLSAAQPPELSMPGEPKQASGWWRPILDIGWGTRGHLLDAHSLVGCSVAGNLVWQKDWFGGWEVTGEYLRKHFKVSVVGSTPGHPSDLALRRVQCEFSFNGYFNPRRFTQPLRGLKDRVFEVDFQRNAGDLPTNLYVGGEVLPFRIKGKRCELRVAIDLCGLFAGAGISSILHFKLRCNQPRSPIYGFGSAADIQQAKVGSFLRVEKQLFLDNRRHGEIKKLELRGSKLTKSEKSYLCTLVMRKPGLVPILNKWVRLPGWEKLETLLNQPTDVIQIACNKTLKPLDLHGICADGKRAGKEESLNITKVGESKAIEVFPYKPAIIDGKRPSKKIAKQVELQISNRPKKLLLTKEMINRAVKKREDRKAAEKAMKDAERPGKKLEKI